LLVEGLEGPLICEEEEMEILLEGRLEGVGWLAGMEVPVVVGVPRLTTLSSSFPLSKPAS
jgi:hypothetical protein